MSEVTSETKGTANASLLIRGAIWIAIGALIAAALVCVVWVLIGNQNGIIGRAFLTILLLAGFAGIAILEAGLATKRPDWLALASMITWIVALIVGAIKIWLPEDSDEFGSGIVRFFQLVLVVGILQLALLHVRLFTSAARRYVTTFTTVIYYVTIAILVLLVGMLVFFLALPNTFEYVDIYWRIVVALAILAAVGTTLIPLLNALFAPKKQASAVAVAPAGYAPHAYAPAVAAPVMQQWPTYADGMTPLPMMQDGQPDWNAYYTGYPTQQPPPYQQGYGQLPAAPTVAQAPTAGDHTVPDTVPAVPDAAPPVQEAAPPVPEAVPPVQEAAPPAQEAPVYEAPAPIVTDSATPDPAAPSPFAPDPGAFPPPPPAPPR